MRLVRWLLALAAGLALVRSGLAVRLIRGIDQRLELFAPHGARAYARHAPRLLAGLYRAVVADALARQPRPLQVVDVGCGPGNLLAALAEALPEARLHGIEPSAEMREVAAERLGIAGSRVDGSRVDESRVEVLDGRAESLPLPDASVDLFVSTLSSHHWEDPAAALREMRRCLAPGGEARIYDVRFAAFSAAELRRLAAAAGWNPEAVRREVLETRVGPFRPFAVAVLSAGS